MSVMSDTWAIPQRTLCKKGPLIWILWVGHDLTPPLPALLLACCDSLVFLLRALLSGLVSWTTCTWCWPLSHTRMLSRSLSLSLSHSHALSLSVSLSLSKFFSLPPSHSAALFIFLYFSLSLSLCFYISLTLGAHSWQPCRKTLSSFLYSVISLGLGCSWCVHTTHHTQTPPHYFILFHSHHWLTD